MDEFNTPSCFLCFLHRALTLRFLSCIVTFWVEVDKCNVVREKIEVTPSVKERART